MDEQDNDVEFGGSLAESWWRFLDTGMYRLGETRSDVRYPGSGAGSDLPDRRTERHWRRRLHTNKYTDEYADWRADKYFDQHSDGNGNGNADGIADARGGLRPELRWSNGTGTAGGMDNGGNRSRGCVGNNCDRAGYGAELGVRTGSERGGQH
jgi:hypothetical protein